MDGTYKWVQFGDSQRETEGFYHQSLAASGGTKLLVKSDASQHPATPARYIGDNEGNASIRHAIIQRLGYECQESSKSVDFQDKTESYLEHDKSNSHGLDRGLLRQNKNENSTDFVSREFISKASPPIDVHTIAKKWVIFENEYHLKGDSTEEYTAKDAKVPRVAEPKQDNQFGSQPTILLDSPNKGASLSLLSGIYIPDIFDIDAEFRKTDPVQNIDSESIRSAEICDLNVMDSDSLLKDTRKQYPNEELFQASSFLHKTILDMKPDEQETHHMNEANSFLHCPPPCFDYPEIDTRREWIFFYRFPEKKRRLSAREWINVKIELNNDTILVSGRGRGIEILKEIPLHPYFAFTLPILHKQKGNSSHTKLHSVKLQYVKYTEKRKMSSKLHLEHLPSYTPVLKIASRDIGLLKHFIETVENVVRRIESHRDIGITHRHEEIFIDCDDICQYEVDGNGEVKRYNITSQIRLRVFVTGAPNLILFVNDLNTCKKQKLKKGDGKLPKNKKWILMENVEYHPCVDVNSSKIEGGVVFKPPDGCSFEIMRFRTRSSCTLPISFKATIDFKTTKSFEIKAECKVIGEGKMMKYQRKNIVVFFGIPASWKTVLVKSRKLNGKKKYLQAKSDFKTLKSGVARTSMCFIEVSTGSARYEPEYSALVWRVGDLPILSSGVPADAVQTFSCHINLPFEIDVTDYSALSANVEFEINQTVGSELQIHEVLVSDKRLPDKWVCYKATYCYKAILNVINQQRLAFIP